MPPPVRSPRPALGEGMGRARRIGVEGSAPGSGWRDPRPGYAPRAPADCYCVAIPSTSKFQHQNFWVNRDSHRKKIEMDPKSARGPAGWHGSGSGLACPRSAVRPEIGSG